MSATDELRRLLDERGVEYRWDNGTVTWFVDGVMYNAWGYDNERLTMSVCHLTPAQAIAATLGATDARSTQAESSGTCKLINAADDLGKGTSSCMCFECGYTALDDWWDEFNYCPNCGRRIEQ